MQRFSTSGHAPSRTSLAGIAGLGAAVSIDLTGRFCATGEIDGVTAFFRAQAMETVAVRAAFAVRGSVLLGARR